MKKLIILLCIIGVTISVNAQNQTLKDYVQCINNHSSTPIEYIFKLFKPKKPSNITEKTMINSYNQFLKH